MSRILVVDDEHNVLLAFQDLLRGGGHEVETASDAEKALRAFRSAPFDLIVMDICLSGMDGLEALQEIKRDEPALPVIVMTAHGTMQTAIEATKLGAFDYLLKPFDPGEMLASVEKALVSRRLSRTQVLLDSESADHERGDVIVGRSTQMQQVYKAIGRVAATDATVLIRGESGTGKELIARAIHQHGHRSGLPMLVVNCVAIPDTLLESELFGYERGAFTGAVARKPGKFEQAHGGTIFLDEIGDISTPIQSKILRVLQERCFQRLGGSETIHVDVRVLAATNRNLETAIAAGQFRDDLYHRLNVVTIQLPPLRDRRDDIPRLVDYFLERFSRELAINRPAVADEALALLQQAPWPGNVRQLAHCLQRVMIFTKGYPIQAADLPLDATRAEENSDDRTPWTQRMRQLVADYLLSQDGERLYLDFVETAESLLIEVALQQAGGNQSHASRLVGLPRPTFHAKMRKYGLAADGS